MSYDLGVFYSQRPLTEEDALDRYVSYCGDEDHTPLVEAGTRIGHFLDRLKSHYPLPDEATDYIGYDCPWSADHDVSEEYVVMCMGHSRASEIVPIVASLAEEHGLVCVDPQQASVLTAPPGIIVAETKATAEEPDQYANRCDAALVDVLDELLKPRGFVRRRRTWRKNDENAVTVLKTIEDCGLFEAHFCVWFKPLGDVDPLKVRPDGKCHIQHDLCSHFLPDKMRFRLLRAVHLESDYVESVEGIFPGGKRDQTVEDLYDYDPDNPITMLWRANTLRQAAQEYLLPLFDRVDAGHYEVLMAEKGAAQEAERLEEREQTLASWRPALARCRDWKDQGLDDGAIVGKMREEIGDCASEAVLLCVAMGWTLDDARSKMSDAGRKWSDLDKLFVEMLFEDEGMLKQHPDGRVELMIG